MPQQHGVARHRHHVVEPRLCTQEVEQRRGRKAAVEPNQKARPWKRAAQQRQQPCQQGHAPFGGDRLAVPQHRRTQILLGFAVERQEREQRQVTPVVIVPIEEAVLLGAVRRVVGRVQILEDQPSVDTVYVPVGGGGLIAGVAAAAKQRRPATRVIGVEPVGAAAMARSVEAGAPVTLDTVGSIADGLLPVRPGDLTFAHVKALVDDVVTVEDEAIAAAVRWLAVRAKLVVEPSGAATVAAVLFSGREEGAEDGATVAVLSGGNIAPAALADLLREDGGAFRIARARRRKRSAARPVR